jgi:uncharacterized protein (TIGR02246 family)
MLSKFISAAVLLAALGGASLAAGTDDSEIRDFLAHWNRAYTGLDASALAALKTPDYEMLDRFGHWIKSEGPEFNQRLWAMTFKDIYRGPARQIESIRILSPQVAIVQARANHPDGVTLDDGTRIPPFWEIDTYTLVRTDAGWRVALLNTHNQINPEAE